jgi:mRNA interferase RelE/StbE
MCYVVVIAPAAKKQIDSLPVNIKSYIANAIEALSENPFIGKSLKAELRGLYSYRVGDYRIIYAILKKTLIIQIIKVMHRREVYR